MIDHLVVGSGPSGAQAAQTLVEQGGRTLMLDVGHQDPNDYARLIPDRPFLDIRRSDPEQHRYFLGDSFEGVPLGELRTGSTITTPRRYVMDLVDRLLPARVSEFRHIESLAQGGLGNAWGLACFAMSTAELAAMGLDHHEMERSYRRIATRIGLSGEHDDCSPYTRGPITELQPALDLDEGAASMLGAYGTHRAALNRAGVFAGKPVLALLSQDLGDRRACAYQDMDFWADHGLSAYRPPITLEQLRRDDRFTYQGGALVVRFGRGPGSSVRVDYRDLASGQERSVVTGSLVLAAGTFGTTRIVMRSVYPDPAARPEVPILCDPYYYVLCLRPGQVGRAMDPRRHSVTQLVLALDETGDGSHVPIAAFTSYRSTLLFRLIKETPLGRRDARALMQFLQSGLMVAGVHHPNGPSPLRRFALERDDASPTGDALRVRFALAADERERIDRDQRVFLRAFRRLGSLPIRVVDLGFGASIHYAGTLPFGEPAPHGVVAATGRLNGWESVFVADGSPFRMLPAKGITLTLMAQADRVARVAASRSAG